MLRWKDQISYDYVAYIDESGDPGLRTVKPIDQTGSSEWLVVGATVVSRQSEPEVPSWVDSIVGGFRGHQRRGFHFTDLNDAKKRSACAQIATKPLRIFAVASNKKNMRGYRNPWAEQLSSDNWFYCWLTRLLLERITHFVKADSLKRHKEIRRVKLEYSNRGGLSYAQMNAYYSWLKHRSKGDRLVLPLGDLAWETMDPSLLEVHAHDDRLGLHLADAVAGAFFKACDKHDTGGCNPEFAKLFAPRMARYPDKNGGIISGYGLKLMPKMGIAKLDPDQAEIFRHYGYPKQWWAPAPNNRSGV